MATSPAPDAAAPPGMCPGIAVKGGGGGGGGGKGGGKGKGGRGGRGSGRGGRGGRSGRKNARNGRGCGGSRSCTGPHPGRRGQAASGHPVDVVTGRVFTDPCTIVSLPGPLPLFVERVYSSEARGRDLGLGFGWTHSLAWSLRVGRLGVEVVTDHGISIDFELPEENDGALGANGWILSRFGTTFVLDTNDDLYLHFEPAEDRRSHRLARLLDPHGNRIELRYEAGVLREIVDSAGRLVSVACDERGRISALDLRSEGDPSLRVASFAYDEAGDLVEANEEAGRSTYVFLDHRLTKHVFPNGLTFHFRYDESGRCFETWGDHADPALLGLADDVPAMLADGTTKAKGILHCYLTYDGTGFTEVVTSVSIDRFFGDEDGHVTKSVGRAGVVSQSFDENGNLVELTDAMGATSRWEYDARGRVTRYIDALGRTTSIERDDGGGLKRIVDPGDGVTEVESFPGGLRWRDPIGGIYEERRDERGQLVQTTAPNGGTARYRYDELGNLVAWTELDGRVTEIRRDRWGRIVAARSPSGAVTSYEHDDARSVSSVLHPDGRSTVHEYDALGRLIATTEPGGRLTRYEWGALDRLTRVVDANGVELRLAYDREGRLVEIRNGRGDRHVFERDGSGLVVRERTVDGRVLRYRYDAAGQLVRTEDGAGRAREYAYDLAGQLVAIQFDDGRAHTFEYDALGGMAACRTPETEVQFERNAVGLVTREVQRVGGDVFGIDRVYDIMGDVRRRATSRGHVATVERDVLRRPTTIDLDGEPIALRYDELGREVARIFSAGGRLERLFDPSGSTGEVRVLGAASSPHRPGEPDWVGPLPPGITARRAYRYDARSELVEVWDSARGSKRYEYDEAGQLQSILGDGLLRQLLAYDRAGNVDDVSTGRSTATYDAAGRLQTSGETEYLWNVDGSLAETLRASAGGAVARTRYHWTSDGLLSAVERPDQTRVEFVYDALARRLEKRLLAADGDPVGRTRYAWDDDTLVHEIREERVDGALAPLWERTYCFEDQAAVPLAHRTVTARGAGDDRWRHYLTDDVGTPDRLIAADGSVVAEIEIGAWGAGRAGADATPLRFRGQYEDEETGLSYNRYRYYDPLVGRYISPDPIGPEADVNLYRYAENRPTLHYDELGLFPDTVYTRPDGTTLTATSGDTGPRDPAINGAVNRARGTMYPPGTDTRGTTFGRCGEIGALHARAAEIRRDRASNGDTLRDPRRENAAIRNEIRSELSRGGGARMVTTDSRGRRMNPCAKCQQILREMGCHPQNRPRGGQGVMGASANNGNVSYSGDRDHAGRSVNTVPATTQSYAPTDANGRQETARGTGRPDQRPRFIPAEEPRDRARERRNQE